MAIDQNASGSPSARPTKASSRADRGDWLDSAIAISTNAWAGVREWAGRSRLAVLVKAQPIIEHLTPIATAVRESGPARYLSSSIRRRIIIGNLIGLTVLLVGWLVLSQQNIWLIDAKRDALETQSRLMATAVAQSAERRARNRPTSIIPDFGTDPNLEPGPSSSGTARSFADFGFKIKPQVAAPVVAKLIDGTETRVRIYETDGTPIVDSSKFLRPDGLLDPTEDAGDNRLTKPKNFWTRFLKWRLASDLPVYQDIDGINGRSYPELKRTIADGKSRSMLLMTESGEQVVAITAPVVRNGTINGVLMLSTRPGEIGEILSNERLRIVLFAAIALLATYAASMWLGRTVAEPLRELSEVAEDVSVDINASERLPTFDHRADEVGQLARSFENMVQKLKTRLQASERFAADVAHELKNPLTAARSMAEALPLARTPEQRADCIEQIQAELNRLNRLITDVSDAQRLEFELPIQETRPEPLLKIAQNAVLIFTDSFSQPERDIAIDLKCDLSETQTIVRCHEGRIGQVLTNLIDNAGSFSPKGATVSIRLMANGSNLKLVVEDEGPGIDEDQIDRIFNRFYTYRPTAEASRGSNSGLGLSIAREIVTAHRGRIWAENRRDRSGARFVIELPRAVISNRRSSDQRGLTRHGQAKAA